MLSNDYPEYMSKTKRNELLGGLGAGSGFLLAIIGVTMLSAALIYPGGEMWAFGGFISLLIGCATIAKVAA
jgi:hypothetical protein